ncbi:FliC/FljB family flagellin [Salmonella enterica subsp. enterica serovar Cerro]|uniref:Flagellin n=1 Tax=Salmonella enterica subsp. enterica serovar Cerro TaxID=340188 RepID=A0A3V7NAT7_SALET|nr:FliC/FljB family flagellin [Salmonella enterica]EBB4444432.1 FliC/FljB family flagellin [Salmonella enterica subsp. enterica serovar Dublin]EBK6432087.1 FliC/FljB family flagellin [Salmonella enterica subsp. enterica serovar Newport]EBL6663034.1 FliC/FljB family flagellin [Salmonella enterica subsp. enterica serovar Rough O:z4,z23:-]EDM7996875.1 flagellin FliC [Salmonella enterica subsp. enterica serovar Give]EDO3991016.1 FliC/FljB family flagellin [Salmonella enterica subsp. enterica serov
MAQVINTNSLSLLTQNNLNKSQSALGTAIERLSSGLRINSAKDDAAGQAIANRFTSNIKGLSQASRNANDGISIAQTTEGALNEINNNLQRVRELSVQAANGSNSGSDLKSIQDEIDQRLNEINRVAEQTDFNGKKVLSQDGQLTIQVGANDGETITIDLQKIDKTELGLDKLDVTKGIATTVSSGASVVGDVKIAAADFDNAKTTGGPAADKLSLTKDDTGNYFVKDVTATAKYYAATVDMTTGKISFDSDKDVTATAGTPPAVTTLSREVKFDGADLKADQSLVKYKDDKGKDLYAIQTLDKDGNATFKSVTFAADGKTTEGTAVDLAANVDPLAKIDDALKTVDAFRSQLGAVQNRFESAITNLGNTVNNLSSARSRIEDSDYATEVSNMSRAQILQQAGTSVLAQANQVPQNVLSLLR